MPQSIVWHVVHEKNLRLSNLQRWTTVITSNMNIFARTISQQISEELNFEFESLLSAEATFKLQSICNLSNTHLWARKFLPAIRPHVS